MIRVIFSFVVVLSLMLGSARVAAASAPVIIVGASSAQCPGAQFSTIQAAVNAAAPGTIIRICPGTYSEQVSITKPSVSTDKAA